MYPRNYKKKHFCDCQFFPHCACSGLMPEMRQAPPPLPSLAWNDDEIDTFVSLLPPTPIVIYLMQNTDRKGSTDFQ